MDTPFWSFWYFHVPNYLAAALAYTMIARFGFSLFVPADWTNYIWRFFVRVTDPVLAAVRLITPSFVNATFLPLLAAFWLTMVRLAFWIALRSAGMEPPVEIQGGA